MNGNGIKRMEAWEGARAVGGDEEGSLRQYFVIILVFVLCVDIKHGSRCNTATGIEHIQYTRTSTHTRVHAPGSE